MFRKGKKFTAIFYGIIIAFFLGALSMAGQKSNFFSDRDAVMEGTEEKGEAGESSFSITFLDVGQADAALVECDGHYMLIDGGNASDSSRIYALLKDKEIQYLDMVVASHAHADHVGGLAGALNYASAGIVLCPSLEYDTEEFASFKKYAEQNGGGIVVPSVGDNFLLGSAVIDILGVNAVQGENDSSIILKITYGENSFIFTGDAERTAEQAVLDSGAELKADVLKVGHHGSDTSTIYPFLREVMPEYAVISVGSKNKYGHPTEAVLSRLRDADVSVYRTDLQGDILCYSDGVHITFQTGADDKNEGSVAAEGDVTYILNTKSKKFHYPTCGSVEKMLEKNKSEYAGSREEVLEMGYEPCGSCKP